MRKFYVHMHTMLNVSVNVELEDVEYDRLMEEGGEDAVREAVTDKAFNESEFYLCAHCSGHGHNNFTADVGDFEVDEDDNAVEEIK